MEKLRVVFHKIYCHCGIFLSTICNPKIEMTTGGDVFLKLPTEIMYEILLRLPSETISVCRAVNKTWYHTIKHPRFIKTYNTHVIRRSSSPSVIHQDDFLPQQETYDQQHQQETSLVFYTQDSPISSIYSCSGWVLSISQPKDPFYYDHNIDYQPHFICNPITGEHMVIPKSLVNPYSAIAGFGWDPVSQVFNVIRISDDSNHRFYYGTYLEVYNSGKGEWRVIKWTHSEEEPCPASWTYRFEKEPCRASWIFRFGFHPNTFLNGSLHWITYPYYESMSIVSLKLDTEEFQQVPMPPGLDMDPVESRPEFMFLGIGVPSDRRIFGHYLLVLGECLSLVHNVDDEHIEIWVMHNYGRESSWEKKYIIRNIAMDGLHLMKGSYKPLKLMPNGEILLSCSSQNCDYYRPPFCSDPEQILGYYHPVTQTFRLIGETDVLYHPSASQPALHLGGLIYTAKDNNFISP